MRSTASTESTTRSGAAYGRSEGRNKAHDSIVKREAKTSTGVKVADAKPEEQSWGDWFRFLGVREPRQATDYAPTLPGYFAGAGQYQLDCNFGQIGQIPDGAIITPGGPITPSEQLLPDGTDTCAHLSDLSHTPACESLANATRTAGHVYVKPCDVDANGSYQTPQAPTPFNATGDTFQTPHSEGHPTNPNGGSSANNADIIAGSVVGGGAAIGGTVGLLLIGRHYYKKAVKSLSWAPETPAPRVKHNSESNSIEFENAGTAQVTSNV